MWSNKYVKIPFVDKGRALEGADCWGLVRIIYQQELGIELPMLNGYEDTYDRKNIKDIISNECARWERVELGEEKPFDVVVFRMLGTAMHIGLVVKPGWMVHCQRTSNTTHNDYLNESEWKCRIEGFYRYADSDRPSTI